MFAITANVVPIQLLPSRQTNGTVYDSTQSAAQTSNVFPLPYPRLTRLARQYVRLSNRVLTTSWCQSGEKPPLASFGRKGSNSARSSASRYIPVPTDDSSSGRASRGTSDAIARASSRCPWSSGERWRGVWVYGATAGMQMLESQRLGCMPVHPGCCHASIDYLGAGRNTKHHFPQLVTDAAAEHVLWLDALLLAQVRRQVRALSASQASITHVSAAGQCRQLLCCIGTRVGHIAATVLQQGDFVSQNQHRPHLEAW
jgi:hypothetical protein